MTELLSKRVTVVWAVLVGATLLSLVLGVTHGIGDARVAAGVLLTVAFVKVWLVGMHFMELREAPANLRGFFTGWCVITGLGVITMLVVA